MINSAPDSEVKKLLKKYESLKAEAEKLKDSDPEKSEQLKLEARQVSHKIEKTRT
ncbi:MAG: Lacal_2735 family protein [Leeuwenhoekiella sp.]